MARIDRSERQNQPVYIRARLKSKERSKIGKYLPTDAEVAEAGEIVAKSWELAADPITRGIMEGEGVAERGDEVIVYNLKAFLARRLQEIRNAPHSPDLAAHARERAEIDADNIRPLGKANIDNIDNK